MLYYPITLKEVTGMRGKHQAIYGETAMPNWVSILANAFDVAIVWGKSAHMDSAGCGLLCEVNQA
jgi:hypothetical protein